MAKELIKKLGEYVSLYRDPKNGIAWVENGHSGTGHGAHPNIYHTGSVSGMKKLSCWNWNDRTMRSHGFIHNIDVLAAHDLLDFVAAEHCGCVGCQERRRRNPQVDYDQRRETLEKIASDWLAGTIDYREADIRMRRRLDV